MGNVKRRRPPWLTAIIVWALIVRWYWPAEAQAAAITQKADILSNNQVNATGVTHVISFSPISTQTSKCLKFSFAGATNPANLTGTSTDVFIDFNQRSGDSVSAGSVTYITGTSGSVTIPFTGTLNTGRIVTATIRSITNGATTGTATVLIEEYNSTDCTGSVLDSGSIEYTLNASTTSGSGTAASELTWSLSGDTTHEYRVDPVNNPTDTNSNTISVTTNAKSFTVRIHNTQVLTGIAGSTSFPGGANGNTLADTFGGTDTSPAPIDGAANSTGFGYAIGSVSNSDKGAYTANTYAAFTTTDPGTNNIVLQKNATLGLATSSATITYKVGTDWTVEAGYYTTTTIYQVTPTY